MLYHIFVYIPLTHKESVKEAMFEAGAGRIGAYRRCAFEVEGMGQYEPLPGSQPFIGEVGHLERVPEVRVEMVCREEFLSRTLVAMKQAHPYEEVAFGYVAINEA